MVIWVSVVKVATLNIAHEVFVNLRNLRLMDWLVRPLVLGLLSNLPIMALLDIVREVHVVYFSLLFELL